MKKDRTEKRQFDSSLRSLGSLGLFPVVSSFHRFARTGLCFLFSPSVLPPPMERYGEGVRKPWA